jgi:hypothetical protein
MSSVPNAAERIAAQTRQMKGKDVVCSHCGSEHMFEVQVTRYLAGGSGSVEIQPDPNEQTFPLLICLCGYPSLPKPAVGRRAGGVYEKSHVAFRASVGRAQDYLNAETGKSIADTILPAVAGKHVEEQVTKLTARVSNLEPKNKTSDGASDNTDDSSK